MAEYESSLCWECKNTNRHKCSWFNPANPQPVPGWVAERHDKSRIGESYLVKECPKFEPEAPREVQPVLPRASIPGVQLKMTNDGTYWVANIMHKRKRYYLGCFPSENEAAAARWAAEAAIKRGEEPRHVKAVRTMGHIGVYHEKHKWKANIMYNGKMYYLGWFKTEADAIAAREAAEEAIARGEEPQRKESKPKEPKPKVQKAKRASSSACPGVYFRRGSWEARASYQGQVYHLGCFKTEEEAVAARKAAEESIKRGMVPRRTK